jgi:hypothetical protein
MLQDFADSYLPYLFPVKNQISGLMVGMNEKTAKQNLNQSAPLNRDDFKFCPLANLAFIPCT